MLAMQDCTGQGLVAGDEVGSSYYIHTCTHTDRHPYTQELRSIIIPYRLGDLTILVVFLIPFAMCVYIMCIIIIMHVSWSVHVVRVCVCT